ncbi:serine/threonine-protein kinase [Kiritimatiellaeota bacterium B1221]|nr:serine/threonine-protein kinase [Kiritimatiellaeota bacterium B1221]
MHDVTLDYLESLNCPHCGIAFGDSLAEAFSPVTCAQCGKESRIPGKFGQFLLYERQGESVTSVVFDAFDPKLGRNVTLKILNYVLSKNPELVEAFKHEALAAAALNSTYVLRVYEFGIHNRQPFMVMEHIEGEFLHEVMQKTKMNEFRILEIMDGIVQGLQDMHDCGIMHGDVMPRNILIHTDGTPRISDFGLARFSGQNSSDNPRTQWESWSSPYYMPPERILGLEEDHRGDFYSLGTTLFNMLTGELPFFDLDESVVLDQKINRDPPDPRHLNSEISDGMAELTGMLLQRDPQDRPDNYVDLREILAEIKASMPRPDRAIPEAEEPPDYQQAAPRKKKEPFIWFIFVVLLGILGAMIVSIPNKIKEGNPPVSEAAPVPTPLPVPPTPQPTATAAPRSTSTPVPQPTPTPTAVPLPSHPLMVSGLQMLLNPSSLAEPNGHKVAEWVNLTNNKVLFSQSEIDKRPQLEILPDRPPVLRFSQSRMASSLQIWNLETFSLLMMIHIPDLGTAKDPMVIIGGDLMADTKGKFIIQTEPSLPYSIRFITERGSAILIPPLSKRGQPLFVGFRRDATGDKAYLGTYSTELSKHDRAFPQPDPERFTGLQLGGIEGERMDFEGWIGEIQFYDRSLDDPEIFALSKRLMNIFGEKGD